MSREEDTYLLITCIAGILFTICAMLLAVFVAVR